MEEISVALARVEEKLDGVVERLEKQNGSIAKLQEQSNRHDIQIVALSTERNVWLKIVKPLLIVLCMVLAALVGNKINVQQLAELFK
jgi:hypothetical protein